MPVNRGSPVRPGPPSVGLGENLGRSRRYRYGPSVEDVMAGRPMVQTGDPARKTSTLGAGHRQRLIETRELPPVLAFSPPVRKSHIQNYQVTATRAIRIDTAMKHRTYIHIANMSNFVVWFSHDSGLVAGVGYPLAANAVADAFNGATYGQDAGPEIAYWAVAVGGTALIVVVEEAR